MAALLVVIALAGLGVLVQSADLGLPVAGLGIALIGIAWLARRPAEFAGVVISAHFWSVLTIGVVTPYKALSVLLWLQMGIHMLVTRQVRSVPRRYIAAMAGMLAWVCLCEVLAQFGASLDAMGEFAGTVATVVVLTQVVNNQHDLRRLIVVQAVSLLLTGMYVMAELSWSQMMAGVVRAGGPCAQPNGLGDYVAGTFPLAIAVAIDRENNKWVRLMAAAAVLGGIYAEFAAASRGGTISLLVGAAVAGILMTVPGRSRFTNLAVAGGFVAVLLVFGPRSFQERVVASVGTQKAVAGGRAADVTSERADHLRVALRMIPQHPLMGWGKEGFPEIRARQNGRRNPPHSVLLTISVAYGVPAAIVYFLIIIAGFVTGIRAIRRWRHGRNYGYAIVAALASAVSSALSGPEYFGLPTWHLASLLFILAHRAPQIAAADAAEDEPAATQDEAPEPPRAVTALPIRPRPVPPFSPT